MNRFTLLWLKAKTVLCGRPFAACVLALLTVLISTFVSVQSHAVTVTDGDVSRVVLTMHNDPYRAIASADVEVETYDRLSVDPDNNLINIDRASAVEIDADGQAILIHCYGGTVADALAQAGITLGEYDTVSEKTDAPVTDGMRLTVSRVQYETYTVTERDKYQTTVKLTPVLKPGKTRVGKAGSDGTKTVTYRKTIVNGKVVKTEQIGKAVIKPAVDATVLKGSPYGTPLSKAPFALSLDKNNHPTAYKTVYTAKSCTAYSIGSRGASGLPLGVGTCAVDPRVIPYGTKLWIASADGKFVYGYAIAADTGAFVGSKTFCDLYFGSYAEACAFGRRDLNIYVLK